MAKQIELTWTKATNPERVATLSVQDEKTGRYPEGVFVVRSWTLESLATKIAAVNRKLAKHGKGVVECLSFTREVEKVYRDETNDEGKGVLVLAAALPYVRSLLYIDGARIQLSSKQSIVGSIERVGSSSDVILTPYGAAGDNKEAVDRLTLGVGTEIRCDHCGATRDRKAAWILSNEDGSLFMVAKSCAKEYFGLNVASLLNDLIDLDSDDTWGARATAAIDRVEAVAFTLAVLRKRGFVSISKVHELNDARREQGLPEIKSTVQILGEFQATQQIDRNETKEHAEQRKQVKAIVDSFRAEAMSTIEALVNCDPQDSFQRNVIALVRSMTTANDFYSHTALLVAGLADYLRASGVTLPDNWEFKKAAQQKKAAAEAFNPGYLGTPAQAVTFTGTVGSLRSYNSQFGAGWVLTLRSAAGLCAKYFGNCKVYRQDKSLFGNVEDLKVGQRVLVVATVKECKQNTFNNVTTDETVLGRPSFTLL